MPEAPPDEAVSPEAAPVPPTADAPVPPPAGPRFRVMDVLSVALELPGQYPTVHLQEAEPPLRDLVFPIGLPEGTALAHALRRVATPRPLTHELFISALQQLGADVATVRLIGRRAGTYLAELVLSGPRGTLTLPCRPSDGLTLALRQTVPAPVLADERLLEQGGDVEPADPAPVPPAG
ncbi:MAG: bifunctional nuclease family protein [Acidimicrobiales bacterium]